MNGLNTWILGFQDEPATAKFSIKLEEQIHEVLLTVQTNAKPAKQLKRHMPGKTSFKKEPTNQATRATGIIQTAPIQSSSSDDARFQVLENRVANLEVSQSKMADKMDSRFDQMASQLQQVISAVCPQPGQPSRARGPEGPTGETPPSKTTRNN